MHSLWQKPILFCLKFVVFVPKGFPVAFSVFAKWIEKANNLLITWLEKEIRLLGFRGSVSVWVFVFVFKRDCRPHNPKKRRPHKKKALASAIMNSKASCNPQGRKKGDLSYHTIVECLSVACRAILLAPSPLPLPTLSLCHSAFLSWVSASRRSQVLLINTGVASHFFLYVTIALCEEPSFRKWPLTKTNSYQPFDIQFFRKIFPVFSLTSIYLWLPWVD